MILSPRYVDLRICTRIDRVRSNAVLAESGRRGVERAHPPWRAASGPFSYSTDPSGSIRHRHLAGGGVDLELTREGRCGDGSEQGESARGRKLAAEGPRGYPTTMGHTVLLAQCDSSLPSLARL